MKINRIKIMTMVIVVLIFTVFLTGCIRTEEQRRISEIATERHVEIANYIEAYLEAKYQEDFQNEGISESRIREEPETSSVRFNFKSNYTGAYFKPVYIGRYANPEIEDTIDSGKVGDSSYYMERSAFEFAKHEKANVDEIFPGYKTNYDTFFRIDSMKEDLYYKNKDVIETKYFDVDYMLQNETDHLDNYYLYIWYFRDVYPENKDEMLADIYKFIMYTRSLGFKSCKVDMIIFEKSFLESDIYKDFINGDNGNDFLASLSSKGIQYISVKLDYDASEKVQTLEDLKGMSRL